MNKLLASKLEKKIKTNLIPALLKLYAQNKREQELVLLEERATNVSID